MNDKILAKAMSRRSVEERLWNADDTLEAAMHGLELLQPHETSIEGLHGLDALPLVFAGERPGLSDDEKFRISRRLHMGLRIATTFNVATTLALGTLRGHSEGFNEWWAPRKDVLEKDPLAKYLWSMRVLVAHVGGTGIYRVMTQGIFGSQTQWAVWLEFPREFDGESRAHILVEKHLASIGVILSDAWAEFSPGSESTGLRH